MQSIPPVAPLANPMTPLEQLRAAFLSGDLVRCKVVSVSSQQIGNNGAARAEHQSFDCEVSLVSHKSDNESVKMVRTQKIETLSLL